MLVEWKKKVNKNKAVKKKYSQNYISERKKIDYK